MSRYSYVAVDLQRTEMRGTIEVPDQGGALRQIRETGLFPTKPLGTRGRGSLPVRARAGSRPALRS
jgi:hypothetical protein